MFDGDNRRFAGGVFTTKDAAEAWIAEHGLSGVLTRYPLDEGVYDWALAAGLFTPVQPHESSAEFIGGFTTAGQEHYHFVEGEHYR